jgi:hypothetical protein
MTKALLNQIDIKKDLYIKLLEFGSNNPDGFTHAQLMNKIESTDAEKIVIEKYFINARTNSYKGDLGKTPLETPFFLLTNLPQDLNYKNDSVKFILTIEAKFKYIDYIELITAIKNARDATRIAIASVIISMLALLVSIVFNIIAIRTPINIDKSQYELFKSISNKIDTIAIHAEHNSDKSKIVRKHK